MKWKGLDQGREGFLGRSRWFAALEIFSRNQGQIHTDFQSPIYRELTREFPKEKWQEVDGRSFFRGYAAAWVNMGVIRPMAETQQKFELTPKGSRLVENPLSLTEFFREYLDNYIEQTDILGEALQWSPIEIIAGILASAQSIQIRTLQHESEKLAQVWHPSLRLAVPTTDANEYRRFRSYLRVLENAEAVQINNTDVDVIDHAYLESMIRPGLAALSNGLEDGLSLLELDEDNRRRAETESVVREGQQGFSRLVLNAYGGTCCVTGTYERSVLEAAHIIPYMGRHSNRATNGLLLAVDIHRLFDKYLLGIEPDSMTVRLSSSVTDPRYSRLDGVRVALPASKSDRPSPDGLLSRYETFEQSA